MGAAAGGAFAASDPTGALSLMDALERQLGLKLETQKRQLPVGPPLEMKISLRAFVRTHCWSRCSEPSTFTSASWIGSATDSRTSACAAWWSAAGWRKLPSVSRRGARDPRARTGRQRIHDSVIRDLVIAERAG